MRVSTLSMWRLLCIFAIINVVLSATTTPPLTNRLGTGAVSPRKMNLSQTRERRPNTDWSKQQSRLPPNGIIQRSVMPTGLSVRTNTPNSINRMDPMTMLLVVSMLSEMGGGTGAELMGILGTVGGSGMGPMGLLGGMNIGAGLSGSTGGANPLRNFALLQNGSEQLLSLSGLDCMMNPRTASGGIDPYCIMLMMQHPTMGM
ncbi:hypothetical protein CHS0354_022900 [Potamilus streckersoni]|uniref:Secreted protein n=1 Tax=Potamilus streckersoni TaxID=2493646 RepID=A0AAE0S288_9BIVA|nr:hypothetical protein CHS0354_022900 [Potamilus streckersoni]